MIFAPVMVDIGGIRQTKRKGM